RADRRGEGRAEYESLRDRQLLADAERHGRARVREERPEGFGVAPDVRQVEGDRARGVCADGGRAAVEDAHRVVRQVLILAVRVGEGVVDERRAGGPGDEGQGERRADEQRGEQKKGSQFSHLKFLNTPEIFCRSRAPASLRTARERNRLSCGLANQIVVRARKW